MTGRRWPEFRSVEGAAAPADSLDFFDLKGVIEVLVRELHLGEVSYRPASVPYLHPGRAAELLVKDVAMGCFGELHPQLTHSESYNLQGRTILAGELDLEAILAAVPERHEYAPVSRFPAALRDIAVIVEASLPAERVVAEIRQGGGELLCDVRLFDVYSGPPIPAGSKSLAFALTYQAADRVLTDGEVNKAHQKIEQRLRHTLDAKIRGEKGGK
jgi:phenylalanyl-tRNA synthetase beta chain